MSCSEVFAEMNDYVREDLIEARAELASRFPEVQFRLAEPLGRHPLLVTIVEERIREVERGIGAGLKH